MRAFLCARMCVSMSIRLFVRPIITWNILSHLRYDRHIQGAKCSVGGVVGV